MEYPGQSDLQQAQGNYIERTVIQDDRRDMHHLPFEVQDIICKQCDFQDQKSLRVTCKTLNDVATPVVFEHFYIALFRPHLDRFVQLSRTPHIAVHVKNFVIATDALPTLPRQQVWENMIDLRPPFPGFLLTYIEDHLPPNTTPYDWFISDPTEQANLRREGIEAYELLPRCELSRTKLDEHWAKYKEYYQQQRDWAEAEDKTFDDAFAMLPNVVTIEADGFKMAGNNRWPPWVRLRRDEILVGPDNWLKIRATGREDDDYDEIPDREDPVQMKAVRCLLKAWQHRSLRTDRSHIRNVILRNTASQPFIDPETAMQLPLDAFSRLDALILYIMHDTNRLDDRLNDIRQPARKLTGDLKSMLGAAKNITSFALQIEGDTEEASDPFHDADDIFSQLGELNFPSLQVARLSFTTNEKSMMSFLRNNASTLKQLNIVDSKLLGEGEWQNVFRAFPGMLKLDSMHLEGLRDGSLEYGDEAIFEGGFDPDTEPHSEAVWQWLQDGIGDMPSLRYEEWLGPDDRSDHSLEGWEDEYRRWEEELGGEEPPSPLNDREEVRRFLRYEKSVRMLNRCIDAWDR